jgi:hypothetical protein
LGSVKVSGRLLHKVPDPETYWNGGHRVWASAYVIDRFVKKMDIQSASNMEHKVRDGLAKGESDGTLGRLFECYVRHLFFKGGGVELRKRRLHSDKRKKPEPWQQFTMPEGLEHKPFGGVADLSIPKEDTGKIWTPGPNFPSVDIILTPNSLFQITISSNHPVKQEPLRKILEKLPTEGKISLYFVVPEVKCETFTFQNYHNNEGKVSQKVPESIKMLEQWVVAVPLGGVLSKENAEQSEVQKRAANEDDTLQPKKRKTN